MSKLPGSTGISLLSDKSLEFYRDPITFCERRIEKHGSRIFQARLLNKSTSFVCSVQGMKELLCGRLSLLRGYKGCVQVMCGCACGVTMTLLYYIACHVHSTQAVFLSKNGEHIVKIFLSVSVYLVVSCRFLG